MKMFLIVDEFGSHMLSRIMVGRDTNRSDLDLVYFKLMTCLSDLCSGPLYNVGRSRV
jgi:hypothetical protein